MTTTATTDAARRLAELDEGTREAWASYRDTLADLQGRAYDAAEASAWEHLQQTLAELDAERDELTRPAAPG